MDLTWLLRRPFSFLPPVAYRDQCQLSPTALGDWLQDQASIPARVGYEARWGVNYTPGSGLPLDWFDSDERRHITAHRMDNIPTMTVLAHRSSHRNTVLDTTCLLCGAQPETALHLWAYSAQSYEWGPARRRLAEWLDQKVGRWAVLCNQLAVGAGCSGAVGGGLANPLHAAGPHGVLWAPHAGDGVHTSHHRGVHRSLVRPRQGACHVAKGPPGPEQHDGVGVAGAAPAPTGGERGSAAGTSGLIALV